MPTRRAILGGAAAIPAAAAIAGTTGIATTIETTGAPTPLLTPYTDYPWRWWVSNDKETYYNDFDTLKEALEYAARSEYSYIAECQQQDFDLSVDGWRILEQLNDDNGELIGEGEGIECTSEQERDLGEMVTAAIEAWAVKHKIRITAWTFAETRNHTDVPLADGP